MVSPARGSLCTLAHTHTPRHLRRSYRLVCLSVLNVCVVAGYACACCAARRGGQSLGGGSRGRGAALGHGGYCRGVAGDTWTQPRSSRSECHELWPTWVQRAVQLPEDRISAGEWEQDHGGVRRECGPWVVASSPANRKFCGVHRAGPRPGGQRHPSGYRRLGVQGRGMWVPLSAPCALLPSNRPAARVCACAT